MCTNYFTTTLSCEAFGVNGDDDMCIYFETDIARVEEGNRADVHVGHICYSCYT